MKSLDEVGGQHPEFRDRKPDLPPWPPLGPESPPRRREAPLPTWIPWFLAALGMMGFVLLFLFAQRESRKMEDEAFLGMLKAAVQQYRSDYGVLPPGDGLGSSSLRESLSSVGPRGLPYLVFSTEGIDAQGQILTPGRSRVFYRSRESGFELWAQPAPRR